MLYCIAVLLPALAGCTVGSVVRVVDGEIVAHRFISGRAYAAYARGVRAETTGHFADAMTAFVEATVADARGVEPWTRRGAVACRLERFPEADAAFAEAAARDDSFEPLWRERASCSLARSDLKGALTASARAESLDPDREEAVLLRANVLERVGDSAGALREVVGLTTRRPSATAWKSQLAIAERAGDQPAARLARRGLAEHPRGPDPDAPKPPAPTLSDLDGALLIGRVSDAEQMGRRLSLNPGALAARAVALGRSDAGGAHALQILGADPQSADAFLAELAASELRLDMAGVEKLLDRGRSTQFQRPSELSVLLLLNLLARRVGPEAIGDITTLPAVGGDQLAARLRAELGARRDKP